MKAFIDRDENGNFQVISEGPHKFYGNTIYDKLPEKVGMTCFLLLTIIGWILWPLYLTQIEEKKKKA